ncbi:sporulation-specific N-acetylmuramoyl-L-alanine amidase CwlC [[Clostridium] sordellii]|uniref:N-acetylmuramoyl-L-alanine amidase n=1 Tax=Paraclostridium sordellii TaxID=1505 RepID=UPI0005DB64C3|nr:N-acetylmuramoyl-L-alanine amidase [Paeniclostridium sordellii]CEN29787.1 sporulation-specific N-acetylmuramoyl-L-alanine amidase CwlC [[Clostridium] sordellii] [Paeniclostridium sordellii]CEN30343.1 sporulation-specific N-acetylmuramoyl-L-alanine amidase CwlC [[Clostridium] sordellii] [Paeniclostridium sordellii]
MKTNMTDAGHGGYDSGAPGLHGCLEKDIVLEVSNKINDYLKTQDIKNINTRTTDVFVSLNERSNKANNLGVNSFVSIHCNSSDNPNAQGLETYCYKFKYRPLADAIHSEIIKEGLYTKNRGVKEGNLHVVRETNMDACLVELGFITNEEDYNLIMNNKDRFAKAIAKGICKFNGVPWKESSNTTSNEGFKNGDYSGRKARVIADVLNVRWDRGTEYEVIGQVKYGDIVNLQYCLNGWVSVEGFKGNKGLGYVSSKFLELI